MIEDKIKRNFLLFYLGKEYGNYSDAEKIEIFNKQVRKIKLLRLEGNSISSICEKLNCKKYIIFGILENESGTVHPTYSYELYKEIKTLKAEGKNYLAICNIMRIPYTKLYRILALKFFQIYDTTLPLLKLEMYLSLKEKCYETFQQVRFSLNYGSKYRNIEFLSYLVIYLYLRAEGANIELTEYLLVSSIDPDKFKYGLKHILKKYSLYPKTNKRKEIVKKKIFDIISYFNLPYEFLQLSNLYLEKFWSYIGNTKDKVIAGVICALVMNKLDLNSPFLNEISKRLGINQSSVYYQIRNNILKKLNIIDFKGIQQSSEVIRSIL